MTSRKFLCSLHSTSSSSNFLMVVSFWLILAFSYSMMALSSFFSLTLLRTCSWRSSTMRVESRIVLLNFSFYSSRFLLASSNFSCSMMMYSFSLSVSSIFWLMLI